MSLRIPKLYTRLVLICVFFILCIENCSQPRSPLISKLNSLPNSTISIQFSNRSENGKCDWNGIDVDSVWFFLPRIYAINQDTVFVFYGIDGFHSGRRSLVLRSEDSGRTWKEVFPPILRAVILNLYFINGNTGWGLAGTGVEGFEDFRLYQTNDGGKNWTQISVLTNNGIDGATEMSFVDEMNGKIVMATQPEESHYLVLRTIDGGLSWKEAETIPYKEYHPLGFSVSKGFDGSEWKLEETKDEVSYIIRRKLSTETDWLAMAALPVNYRIKNGCLLGQ